MDKKSFHDYYALDHTQESLKTHPRRPYRSRRVLYTLLTVILSCLCFFHISWVFFRWPTNFSSIKFRDGYQELSTTGQKGSQYVLPSATNKTFKVPLEAHVMSKCPDAKDCLRDLVVPAMEKVVDKVDFRLSFIGSIDEDDSIICKHGPSECLGNIVSLCAADLYPNNTKISLGFSTCMISSYTEIPNRSLIENCASEHGMDFGALNECISEEGKGMDLLRDSVERSQKAGVKYSCTVRLDDDIRCIRDGGEWKDCSGGSKVEDLVGDVEKLYQTKFLRAQAL